MLQLEPSKRITTKGAIEHPFFNEFRNQGGQPAKSQTSLCCLPVITPKKHTHVKLQKENVNPAPSGKTPDKVRIGAASKSYNFYNNQSNSNHKSIGSNTKMSYPDPFGHNRSDSILDNEFPFRPLNKPDTPTYSTHANGKDNFTGGKAYSNSVCRQPLVTPCSNINLILQNNSKSDGVNPMSTPKNFSTNKKLKNVLGQGSQDNSKAGFGLGANSLAKAAQQNASNTSTKKRRRTTNRLNIFNDENDDKMNLQYLAGEGPIDHQMTMPLRLNQNGKNEYIKINESGPQTSQNFMGQGLDAAKEAGQEEPFVVEVADAPGLNNIMNSIIKDNDQCMTIDEDVELAKSYIPYHH